MAFEKDQNEVGVLWQKHGKKGAYMTGEIQGIGPVVVFGIGSKNPRAPHWRVLKSQPRGERETLPGGFEVESRERVGEDDFGF